MSADCIDLTEDDAPLRRETPKRTDVGGSAVQGDSPSANQLGKAIGAAVQAELIKQKRPGGLLSR